MNIRDAEQGEMPRSAQPGRELTVLERQRLMDGYRHQEDPIVFGYLAGIRDAIADDASVATWRQRLGMVGEMRIFPAIELCQYCRAIVGSEPHTADCPRSPYTVAPPAYRHTTAVGCSASEGDE